MKNKLQDLNDPLFDFTEAWQIMQEGGAVTRAAWKNISAHLTFHRGFLNQNNLPSPSDSKWYTHNEDIQKPERPPRFFLTIGREVLNLNYAISAKDFLATDWSIYYEK